MKKRVDAVENFNVRRRPHPALGHMNLRALISKGNCQGTRAEEDGGGGRGQAGRGLCCVPVLAKAFYHKFPYRGLTFEAESQEWLPATTATIWTLKHFLPPELEHEIFESAVVLHSETSPNVGTPGRGPGRQPVLRPPEDARINASYKDSKFREERAHLNADAFESRGANHKEGEIAHKVLDILFAPRGRDFIDSAAGNEFENGRSLYVERINFGITIKLTRTTYLKKAEEIGDRETLPMDQVRYVRGRTPRMSPPATESDTTRAALSSSQESLRGRRRLRRSRLMKGSLPVSVAGL
ncbi:hypothetical protein C8R47DRAFT_1073808 [Mycena vitilis]|nr:hypothetical protein C8R47DRAFT_1073808 [Mycena vitilis]